MRALDINIYLQVGAVGHNITSSSISLGSLSINFDSVLEMSRNIIVFKLTNASV